MKKIMQLIGGGEIGGAERHVLTLLEGLDQKEFMAISGCLINGPFSELTSQRGIPTKCFPMKSSFDFTPLPGLMKEMKRLKISLIHTHGSRANLLGRLAGKLLKIPVISTVHSSLREDYLSPKIAHFALILDRFTLPMTSGLITVSESLAKEVSDRGGKNIRTIYNGISPLLHLEDEITRNDLRSRFRSQWKAAPNAMILGCIARMHPTKGLIYLIEAFSTLYRDFPNLHLVIIGDGPLRSELAEILQSRNLPFTFTGFVDDAYVTLPAMDLFILPSISEGMGIVLLEAMQAHVPVIATNVGGIPEVIRNGTDGILVSPKDPKAIVEACHKVLSNRNFANILTENAASHWRTFSQSEMLRQTQTFYREILHKN